jgi:long-subunit acyl-CoA synthetase (AMP-forming)
LHQLLSSKAVNYRLKADDVEYIFDHSDAEAIIVDQAFVGLLQSYSQSHPSIQLIVDTDTEKEDQGQYNQAVLEGLEYDIEQGSKGWAGLEAQTTNEEAVIALAYTSGTTGKPKGVEYTHRGSYLAALANIIESGLNYNVGRCRYLWTLPMFHAVG